jgi:integrase
MPIPEVSQRLGHAHPGITMGVYAHVLGQSYKAVQIMEEVLK